MDLSELRDINSLHIEGTDTGRFRLEEMVYRGVGTQKAPLNSHWLVLKNCSTDLHDCWFVDSIYKECTRSITTKQ